eukprot:8077_1
MKASQCIKRYVVFVMILFVITVRVKKILKYVIVIYSGRSTVSQIYQMRINPSGSGAILVEVDTVSGEVIGDFPLYSTCKCEMRSGLDGNCLSNVCVYNRSSGVNA